MNHTEWDRKARESAHIYRVRGPAHAAVRALAAHRVSVARSNWQATHVSELAGADDADVGDALAADADRTLCAFRACVYDRALLPSTRATARMLYRALGASEPVPQTPDEVEVEAENTAHHHATLDGIAPCDDGAPF